MSLATFDANGFEVTANNAIDYMAGTQAASSGMVAENIRETSSLLRADLSKVNSTLVEQTDKLADINTEGFEAVGESVSEGFSTLNAISGASLAVQATGFAVVAKQLHGLRGDVNEMHEELAAQGERLIELQETTNRHLQDLVAYASRTLETQEKILETLVSSKTVEAEQFIRQGWDNLVNGYEEEAFERFQRSLEYDNTVYLAHAELGRIYDGRGKDDLAEDHYVRAVRFAGKAGDKIKAFAHLQYARFLEQRTRYSDAIEQVDEALALDAIDPETREGWKFYHAELLAQDHQTDKTLSEIEHLIERDDEYFVAAMGSESLQKIQPDLSEKLVELDRSRRAPIFQRLNEISPQVRALEVLNPENGREFLERSRNLFEEALTAEFDELSILQRETTQLAPQIQKALDSAIQSEVSPVKRAISKVQTRVKSTPQSAPDRRSVKSDNQSASISPVVLIVSGLIAGVVGWQLVSMPVGAVAALIMATVVWWIHGRLKMRARRQQSLAELDIVIELNDWLDGRDELIRPFYALFDKVRECDATLREVESILGTTLSERKHLPRAMPTQLPEIPRWIIEEARGEYELIEHELRSVQKKYLEFRARRFVDSLRNVDTADTGDAYHNEKLREYRQEASSLHNRLKREFPEKMSDHLIAQSKFIGLLSP